MASTPFVQLAGSVIEAMGQRLDAAKPTEEGLVVRTGDGFLFVFLEDPTKISLEAARRLAGGDGAPPAQLVVLTPGHLPLVIAQDLLRRDATIVEGQRFAELARQLGLESWLGEEPRAAREPSRRLLPSAQQLDEVMHRAQTWLGWGVPALALRFFRQAADMKPDFTPARTGIGRSLLALGLIDDADRAFDEVLRGHPDDLDARLGKAAVLGARAQPREEVALYRTLLAEDEARTEVRAHLVAALVDQGEWRSARVELEAMLERTPEDPQLRFLHAVALEKTDARRLGEAERDEARRLGLSYEREVALCEHLGLPKPPAPPPTPVAAGLGSVAASSEPPPAAPAPARRKPTRRAPAARARSAAPRKRK